MIYQGFLNRDLRPYDHYGVGIGVDSEVEALGH